jgi:hypothetical protein
MALKSLILTAFIETTEQFLYGQESVLTDEVSAGTVSSLSEIFEYLI